MSTTVTVEDHTLKFASLADAAMDRALNNAGVEILRLSKNQAPHLHGLLWASGKLERKSLCSFEVSYTTPYAAYQERGMREDGSYVVQNYTKPGSKAHYLQDPGDMVTSKEHFEGILKAAADSVRV